VKVSFDFLERFSWWTYLLTAIIYTALSFYGKAPNTRAWVFSKGNGVPVSRSLLVHLGFLALLFTLMRFIASVYRFMPGWLTEMGGKGSAVDILVHCGGGARAQDRAQIDLRGSFR
jgi:hypothetical protein